MTSVIHSFLLDLSYLPLSARPQLSALFCWALVIRPFLSDLTYLPVYAGPQLSAFFFWTSVICPYLLDHSYLPFLGLQLSAPFCRTPRLWSSSSTDLHALYLHLAFVTTATFLKWHHNKFSSFNGLYFVLSCLLRECGCFYMFLTRVVKCNPFETLETPYIRWCIFIEDYILYLNCPSRILFGSLIWCQHSVVLNNG